jgi:peptidoglycan hydrolase-like protein with peptidoglycan-binding domain
MKHLYKVLVIVTAVLSGAVASGSPAFASTGNQPTLAKGATSAAVVTLQQDLGITADGDFGPGTQAAVEAFQLNKGITSDGVVGRSTWNLLDGGPNNTGLSNVSDFADIDSRSIIYAERYGVAIDAYKLPASSTNPSDILGYVRVLKFNSATDQVGIVISTQVAFAGTIQGVTYTTPNGFYAIQYDGNANTVSHTTGNWNGAPMPYAAFFYEGDAFHYDSLVASHGCVHIPSMLYAQYINSLGTDVPVVIHG